MSALIGLQCHVCKATFPAHATYVCDKCLGPLEPVYDYDAIKLTRERSRAGRRTSGATASSCRSPASRRPASTPASRRSCAARGWPSGSASASCTSRTIRSIIRRCRTRTASSRWRRRAPSSSASTCWPARRPATSPTASRRTPRASGWSAASSSPTTSRPGKVLGSAIFGPTILAIAGNYDDVNRLCTQVADRLGWGFVNINLRVVLRGGRQDATASRSSSSSGWRFPQHVVSPVAGGTLLPRIARGFRELRQIGLVEGELPRIHAAQAAGCAPVVRALEAAPSIPNRFGRTRSPSRSRSAIRPTATRCCRRSGEPAARAQR